MQSLLIALVAIVIVLVFLISSLVATVQKTMKHEKSTLEDYPELKSNENTLSLQHSLNEIEEQLSAARRAIRS